MRGDRKCKWCGLLPCEGCEGCSAPKPKVRPTKPRLESLRNSDLIGEARESLRGAQLDLFRGDGDLLCMLKLEQNEVLSGVFGRAMLEKVAKKRDCSLERARHETFLAYALRKDIAGWVLLVFPVGQEDVHEQKLKEIYNLPETVRQVLLKQLDYFGDGS